MRVIKELSDNRFKLLIVEWNGNFFIYLLDRKEKTESLGVIEKEKFDKVEELWSKYRKDSSFCLPCELLLIPKEKVLKGENAVAELGLTLERLEKFKREVKDEGS